MHIPFGKVIVFGSMPLLDNIRNLSLADRTILVGTNYEVMGLLIAKLIFLVRLDALLVTRPSLGHLAKSPCDNLREIVEDVLGMPTSESHFVGKDKIGTYVYRGKDNLIDQIIVSSGLMSKGPLKLVPKSLEILDLPKYRQQEGKYAHYPFRFWAGNRLLGGYSDHLAISCKVFVDY